MTPLNIDELPTITVKVHTPDGTMFVHIIEYKGKPYEVMLNIGKSGYSLAAWANALARVVSLALRSGSDLQSIIAEVSNIKTGKSSRSNGIEISSGPAGLAHALMLYAQMKDKEKGDDGYRPATMGS